MLCRRLFCHGLDLELETKKKMSSRVNVAALKQQLEQLFPGKWLEGKDVHKPLLTGICEIDNAGVIHGLSRRKITEWFGKISSGKTTLLRQSIRQWCAEGFNAAYVDAFGRLCAADWAFVDYRQKGQFWVFRSPRGSLSEQDAIWACEQLLRSNIFDVVVIDLASFNLTSRMYARLQRSLDRSRAALVLLRDEISNSSSSWGASARLGFNWSDPVDSQPGLDGVAAFMPSVKSTLWRDGLVRCVEVGIKANAENRLFTHPQVPDRRSPQARA